MNSEKAALKKGLCKTDDYIVIAICGEDNEDGDCDEDILKVRKVKSTMWF